jgi:phage protein D
MLRATYSLSVAGWSADSADDPRTELVELDVLHRLNSPAGHCRVTAYAPGGAAPSQVAPGDTMSLELTSGSQSATVATVTVKAVETSLELVTIVGTTGMQPLAETRVNQVYENQSLGQVVRDLASQAGVDVGDVEQGGRYPYLVVHESRSVLRTVLGLARREGMDVWVDPDGRLNVKAFAKARADHVLRYGVEVLALEASSAEPVAEHVLVHGESPSSSTGADTWHWLAQDLSPHRGESGSGARTRAVQDGAIRTKAAADAAAKARLDAIVSGAATGRVTALGRPTIKLGDALALEDVPGGAIGGVLRLGSVRHVFNGREGYVTILGFSGQGPGPGGALGGAGQALGAALS